MDGDLTTLATDRVTTYPAAIGRLRSVLDRTPALQAAELARAWRAERELPELVPEAHVVVRPFVQGPPIAAPVVLRLVGDELERLVTTGASVRAAMAATPGVLHTRASIPEALPAVELRFDEAALRAVGLSAEQAARQLRAQLEGLPAGEVLEGTERIPVVVRSAHSERDDGARLLATTIVAGAGGDVVEIPVAAVADLAVTTRIPTITRRNGERCNELLGFVGADALPIEVLADVQTQLRERGFQPPPGLRLELGGDAEESDAAAAHLLRYVPRLAPITMATLVLAFRSVVIALLLAVVGCLSAGYGLLSLWLGGYPLGFNPLIGLAGLVVGWDSITRFGVSRNTRTQLALRLRLGSVHSGGNDRGLWGWRATCLHTQLLHNGRK
jgi:multidrug efflux pump subunit AcrB